MVHVVKLAYTSVIFVSAGLNPWNKLTLTNCEIITFQRHWKWKINAIQMYKSKFDVCSATCPFDPSAYTFWSTYCIINSQTFLLQLSVGVYVRVCMFVRVRMCIWKRSGRNVFCRAGKVSLLKISLTRRKFFSPAVANSPQIGWRWKLSIAKLPPDVLLILRTWYGRLQRHRHYTVLYTGCLTIKCSKTFYVVCTWMFLFLNFLDTWRVSICIHTYAY